MACRCIPIACCLFLQANLALILAADHAAQDTSADSSKRPALRTFFAWEREIWQESGGASLVREPIQRHTQNPVLPRGQGEELDSHRIDFTSILPEGNRLRAWYGAIRGGRGSINIREDLCVAYAESEDGIHWVKPKLEVAEPGTNQLIRGAAYMTVAPAEEGRRGYRAAVAFFRPDSGATFAFASSEDGLHWDFDGEPDVAVQHFEAYGLYHRDGRWWVLGQGVPPYFHQAGDGLGYRVMYGFHREEGKAFELYPRPLFKYPAHRDFPDASLQQHVGAGMWDRGRVIVGIAGQFWPGGFSSTASYSMGLIYSYDGLAWNEPFPETPLMTPDRTSKWDNGWLLQIQRPVSRDKRTFFYYVGGDGGNEWATHASVGLATLRRDGFAALTPAGEEAELVTMPLQLAGGEGTLYLNAAGGITIKVVDVYRRPVAPPVEFVQDDVRAAVLDLRSLKLPERFRLSFTLRPGAKLYTFSFGPEPSQLAPLETWE